MGVLRRRRGPHGIRSNHSIEDWIVKTHHFLWRVLQQPETRAPYR